MSDDGLAEAAMADYAVKHFAEVAAKANRLAAELAGAQQAESALRVERDAARAECRKWAEDLHAEQLAHTETRTDFDFAMAEFQIANEQLARALAVIDAERAGNALLSETVTTLTEQRDLCAAEAERMRAVLRRELDACFCDDRDGNCNPPAAPECARCLRLRAAIASPSTATRVLADRDERARKAQIQDDVAAIKMLLSDDAEGHSHGLADAVRERDERVRAEAAGAIPLAVAAALESERNGEFAERQALETKLVEVTAERDDARGMIDKFGVKAQEAVDRNVREMRSAVTALAATQAYVAELREALRIAQSFIFDDTCRHDSEKVHPLEFARSALARESSTATLREFGLKIAKRVTQYDRQGESNAAAVDAVLRGDQ